MIDLQEGILCYARCGGYSKIEMTTEQLKSPNGPFYFYDYSNELITKAYKSFRSVFIIMFSFEFWNIQNKNAMRKCLVIYENEKNERENFHFSYSKIVVVQTQRLAKQ